MHIWTRRNLLTVAAATGAASLLPTAGATARTAADPLVGTAPTLHPEGIAWDPTRRAFLVSSVRHGTVSVVRRDGAVRTLIADPRMVSTLGVHVDVRRRRVLVAFADLGIGERTSPQTVFQAAGLGIFDLITGRPHHLVPLTSMPGGHVANDVAIDAHGTAYVTDPASDGLYQVDVNGRAEVFVQDPRLANPSVGLNGVAWHPAGFLLTVNYTTGELWRIDPDASVHPVTLDRPLVGGDGLALLPSGRLVVVTNAVLAPGEDAVRTLAGGPGWTHARTLHMTSPWSDPAPSTAVATPAGVFVVSGGLDLLFQQGLTTDRFTIRRYP